MPPTTHLHTERQRANSFGSAAQRYDAYRPGYPDALISDLLAPDTHRVLDVGAGTGIVSRQLTDHGCTVLAVEPDERMAAVARDKGIAVEIATFEDWEPAGRRFDLVTFAASFHWVDPAVALPKVATVLTSTGRLALLWNRLRATRPLDVAVDDVFGDYVNVEATDRLGTDAVVDALTAAGFGSTVTEYPRTLRFSIDQWLELLFTYSTFITLEPAAADDLRHRLTDRIGDAELTLQGDSLAIVATPHRER
ncbi:MAG: class I SAM-dependent methyltransferase [Mycobacterium sp.]